MRHFEILDFFSRPDLILNLYLHTHTLFLSLNPYTTVHTQETIYSVFPGSAVTFAGISEDDSAF